MPLIASEIEQINPFDEDSAGDGPYLLTDYVATGFGFYVVQNADAEYSIFFIDDGGEVAGRAEIGADTRFLVARYDDGVLVYPENDSQLEFYPPRVYRPDGSSFAIDPEQLESITPEYRLGGGFVELSDEGGEDLISSPTSATLTSGRTVEVFLASDGEGTGVFVQLYGPRGGAIGDPLRVNDDTRLNQTQASVIALDDNQFIVTWNNNEYTGVSAATFLSRVFTSQSSLDRAIRGDGGDDRLSGDAGDLATDIFFYDTAGDLDFGADRIVDFGARDVLVTTTRIGDANRDGVITFGRDRRLDLQDGAGDPVGELSIAGVRSLEFDGQVTSDGVTYYVYSLVGSSADEGALIF